MAYIPWQQWRSLYEAEKGFCLGTIFAELDMPFHGKGGCCR
ncbi:spore coat associated protein CotJA [Dorea sp. YH-dor226]